MKGRIKEDDSSVPAPDGPWSYNSRYVVGGQYPLVVRTPRSGGPEQIMIDGNKEAEGQALLAARLGGSLRPITAWLAYGD